MKIGIISDTHGSVGGWEKAWRILKESDLIVHCGDLFNHGPGNPVPEKYNPKELLNIFNTLDKPILIAKGNCDSEVDQTFLNIPMANPFLFFQINDIRFLVSHGHIFKKDEWINLGEKWKVNVLISGHTHIPNLENTGKLIILNPGSPSIPKEKPTVALLSLEEKKVEIFELENYKKIKQETF